MIPEREEQPPASPTGRSAFDDPVETMTEPDGPADPTRSLLDDVGDLVLDAKTWLDAELSYQKTRAGFVSACLKNTVALAIMATVIAFISAIGLTVGLIIALAPLITIWGSLLVVVGGMLLISLLLLRRASRSWSDMMDAIHEADPAANGEDS